MHHALTGRDVPTLVLRVPWVWLALVLCVMPAAPGRAADGAANRTEHAAERRLEGEAAWARLAEVAKQAADVTALEARFTQKKYTPLLLDPLVSQGVMRMAGGVQRWDTQEPHASVLLIDGRTLRLYYPEQRSLEVYPLDRQLGRLSLTPVPQLELLRKYFSLSSVVESPDVLTLRLRPADEALGEQLDEVVVRVDPKTALVRQVEMVGTTDERTVLTFAKMKVNPEIVAEAMALKVPEGTQVSYPLGKPGEADAGDGR